MQNLSDEEIVQRIVAGETKLYNEIMLRYQDKLERYVLRLTNRPLDVEDIVQDTFLKVYRNLPAFNPKLKFSSWIYRIAHNESINHIRSGFIQRFVSLDGFFNLSLSQNIEEDFDNKLDREKLDKCLGSLELKYREPLLLHVFEEKSYEEISDILRIPTRTVGVLIHRAKQKIKSLCKNHEKQVH